MGQERLARNPHQRFGGCEGQGTHARAKARCQHHGRLRMPRFAHASGSINLGRLV